MKKFSVVFQHLLIVAAALALPAILLFSAYANRITNLAVSERESSAQSYLQYVSQTFELLADSASAEAVRITSSEDYITAAKDFKQYDQVIRNAELQEEIRKISERLATVQFADERLRNIYLYTLGSDYVITSDRALLRFSALSDAAWLDSYMSYANEADVLRMPVWIGRTTPESDLLSNGSHDSQTPVITYIMPVRIANSRSLSLLIMNYYETRLAELINVSPEHTVFIVDNTGTVVCHPDLSMLGKNLSGEGYLQQALQAGSSTGSFRDSPALPGSFKADDVLYSYLHTDIGDWILINQNHLHTFSQQAMGATRSYLVALVMVLLLGGMLCLHATRRLWAPLTQLSRSLDSSDGSIRNEVLLIEGEIRRLQQREQELLDGMQDSQGDVKKLYLLSLLRDTPWIREVPVKWPHAGFAALILEQDASAEKISPTALLSQALTVLGQHFRTEGVVLDSRTCVLLLNMDQPDDGIYERITQCVTQLRTLLAGHSGLSFTAGTGLWQEGESGAYESYRQAITATRQRLLHGRGQTIVYHEDMTRAHLYCYSKKCETVLLNGLAAANEQTVIDAIALLRTKLLELDVDNILQVINQLTGVVAAWLMENYAIDDIFEGGMQAWYAEENAAETLDELLSVLRSRALAIVAYLEAERSEFSHIDNIMDYIHQHYMEDIDFERMAEEIGVSYSHARRLVKHKTNQSLLDVVNEIRIEQAKLLLRGEPSLSIKDIAARVGYHNIQSFNRFFKKFECITPSEYRGNQN